LERGKERGAIAFKLSLAYFHPLPYPSPIKELVQKIGKDIKNEKLAYKND